LLTQSLYRYAIAAIPLACIAAGLCFTRLHGGRAFAGADPERQPTAPAAAVPPGGASQPGDALPG
jgi:hypothetical protein